MANPKEKSLAEVVEENNKLRKLVRELLDHMDDPSSNTRELALLLHDLDKATA